MQSLVSFEASIFLFFNRWKVACCLLRVQGRESFQGDTISRQNEIRNKKKKRKEKHDLLSIEIENFFAINKNRKRFGKFLFLGTINVGSNWRERMENEGVER